MIDYRLPMKFDREVSSPFLAQHGRPIVSAAAGAPAIAADARRFSWREAIGPLDRTLLKGAARDTTAAGVAA